MAARLAHKTTQNAFDSEFLRDLDRRDEPSTGPEAETAGPWWVSPLPHGGWGVFGSPHSTDPHEPIARFLHREHALVAAAVLPGTGRDPEIRLDSRERSEGFALLSADGRPIGALRNFDQPLADALHVVDCLLRSPAALANLLEAAGATALTRAGRILRSALPYEPPADSA